MWAATGAVGKTGAGGKEVVKEEAEATEAVARVVEENEAEQLEAVATVGAPAAARVVAAWEEATEEVVTELAEQSPCRRAAATWRRQLQLIPRPIPAAPP